MKTQPIPSQPQPATDRAMRTCRVLVISLVLSSLTSSLPAQSTHRDPDGCYTLTVPAGWRASENDRGTLLSAPNAGMLITAGPPRRAESVLAAMNEFVGKQWRNCREVERGDSLVAGRISPWRLIAGTGPKDVPMQARLVCVSVGEGIVSLMGTVAQKGYAAMKPVFESVEKSLSIDQSALVRMREDANREVEELVRDLEAPPAAPAGRVILGVLVRDLTAPESAATGVRQGVVVEQVGPGTPAAAAGIAPGDTILSVARKPVSNRENLIQTVSACRPGEEVEVIVLRRGQRLPLKVRFAADTDSRALWQGANRPPDVARRENAPPAAAPGKSPAGTIRFRRVSVEDRQIIGGEAFSFLVPVEWKVEGGIVWRPHPALPAGAQLRVSDPASRQQLEAFPAFPFTWGDNCGPGRLMPIGALWFGNEVHPPFRSAAECLETTLIPRIRGAYRWRVTQRESHPRLAAAKQQNSRARPNERTSFDAARVRIEYDLGGRPVEEDIFGVMETAHVPAGNIVLHVVDQVIAMRADRGQLDATRPVHLAIYNSSKVNLQWFNRYVQIVAFSIKAKMEELEAVGAFSRALARTSSQISNERMRQWEETNRGQDRLDRERSEYVRGTETFDDPVRGEPVELPSTHRHAWVSRGGEYILTDNPNLNPNVEGSGTWVQMTPTK